MFFPLNTGWSTSAQGTFGHRRRHEVHTGVDLYTMEGAQVFAMEDAEVVAIENFTGPPESPWWLPTKAILAEGNSGVIVYGEVDPNVIVGQKISAREPIATVIPVLPIHKTRPDIPGHSRWMLHMELYVAGTRQTCIWSLDQPQPVGLLDPTAMLYGAYMMTNYNR